MSHDFYIRRCLELAKKGEGCTSPNPMVGAVIVQGNKIIAEGFHRKFGGPHAEIEAMQKSNNLKGVTLYTNLEPCCHQGKTGPCTNAIIKAGIKSVVVGTKDPNQPVNGKGITALREKGICVKVGILQEECERLNEAYFKFILKRVPFVVLKIAATLDGMVATRSGDSKWITSPDSRDRVHQMRDKIDAILVGANTVMRDDPRLTTRLPKKKGKDPIRVILDSALYVDPQAKVFAKNGDKKTKAILITEEHAPGHRVDLYEKQGVRVLRCKLTGEGRLDLNDILQKLGKEGIASLMVEGGAGVHSSFVGQGLVDKVFVFLSPRFMGGGALPMFAGLTTRGLDELPALKNLSVEQLGPDILVTGYLRSKRGLHSSIFPKIIKKDK